MFTLRGKKPNTFTATTVQGKVDEIVKKIINNKMTDYEKALVLHNWLIANANYDLTFSNYNADGVLLKKTGVCQSYAYAYSMLLDKVGIPNTFEHGDDHVWNLIKIGDSWTHVDVTWDDPVSSTYESESAGGHEQIYWFGLTDYALEGVSNHERYDRPYTSNNYKVSYAYKSGKLSTSIKQWGEMISEQIKAKKATIKKTLENVGNGLNERMAVQMARDTGITVNKVKYSVTINLKELNSSQYELTIKPKY